MGERLVEKTVVPAAGAVLALAVGVLTLVVPSPAWWQVLGCALPGVAAWGLVGPLTDPHWLEGPRESGE